MVSQPRCRPKCRSEPTSRRYSRSSVRGRVVIVQIYETTTSHEARELARCGVDHVGVLVGAGTFARELPVREACVIFAALPPTITRVALSLSADPTEIAHVITGTKPDIIHLGAAIERFPLEQTRRLRARFPDVRIMRSIPVVGEQSLSIARQHADAVDLLLLDSHDPGDVQIGALGRPHDWQLSRQIVDAVQIPVVLAGGLGPANVAAAIRVVRPAGVDSKSNTDRGDGCGKDLVKVRAFVAAAKEVAAALSQGSRS